MGPIIYYLGTLALWLLHGCKGEMYDYSKKNAFLIFFLGIGMLLIFAYLLVLIATN